MGEVKVLTKKRRKKKRIIITATLSVAFLLASIFSISIYVGWNLIKPKRAAITETPNDYGMEFEDISFFSQYDQSRLNGWWIPAQNDKNKTVIFAHGYKNNRTMEHIQALQLAKHLTEEGYNVLTFDFRGSGTSGGEFSTIGQYEKFDLLSAIAFAKNKKGSQEISLLGWSMGGVAVILAGVESPDVHAIIADSPFSNLSAYLKENLPHWSHLPSFPFTSVIMGLMPMMANMSPEAVNPAAAVKDLSDKRLLLIHSKGDQAIPYENSVKIFESIPDKTNTELWLTEKADHVRSYPLYPTAYEERVLKFLAK